MEIEQYLRVFVNQRQEDWSEWLPLAEFAYNNRIHSATHRTPFEMDNGQHPRMGVEPRRTTRVEAAEEFLARIEKAKEEAQAALRQAAEDMSRYYNARRKEHVQFKAGDKVWLDSRNIKTKRPSKKLDDRWFGPFVVDRVISNNAYKLKLTPAFKGLHPVFHVSLLRRYTPDEIAERQKPTRPEPELDEQGEKVYEVEAILDSRYRWGRLEYLVKWKGYGPEENLWLKETGLGNAKRAVADFHRDHPSAPRRISAAVWQALPFQRYENLTVAPRCLYQWEDGATRRDAES